MENKTETIKLPSGRTIALSQDAYSECFLNFDEWKESIFYSIMDSGYYFPQIMQFIFAMIGICNGYTSFVEILCLNLIFGIGNMILWYLFKLFWLPGINTICSLIGHTVFKFKLNWVAIGIVALLVANDWKVILYSAAGAAITSLVKTFLFTRLSSVRYNDKIACIVLRFRTR